MSTVFQQAGRIPQRITKGRKDVVTAFIRRDRDNAVLLVQRSDKVSTYQGFWGGVSGGVEGNESLRRRAEIEIEEEVGFKAGQIEYIRSGRPLYIDDGPKRKWAVHPFLFRLCDPNAIPKLNWENETVSYYQREGFREIETVPNLLETLDRVLTTPKQEEELDRIARDRSHGAAELAQWVCNSLQAEIERQRSKLSLNSSSMGDLTSKDLKKEADSSHQDRDNAGVVLESLRNYAYHLATCRPSMSPLANIASMIMSVGKPSEKTKSRDDVVSSSPLQLLDECQERIEQARAHLKHTAKRLLDQTIPALRAEEANCILTLSKSSSVTAMIEKELIQNPQLGLIVSESRPLFEGVAAAQYWAKKGCKNVTVITEAQIGLFMKDATCVLIGADTITSTGVVNKVGTRLAALAAQADGIPVYALSDSLKVSPGPVELLAHPGDTYYEDRREGYHGEEKEKDEVIQSWPTQLSQAVVEAHCGAGYINIANVYFEETPLELFAGVITEQGKLSQAEVAHQISRWKDMYVRAFALEIE